MIYLMSRSYAAAAVSSFTWFCNSLTSISTALTPLHPLSAPSELQIKAVLIGCHWERNLEIVVGEYFVL